MEIKLENIANLDYHIYDKENCEVIAMDLTFIIMLLGSVGFILMGGFILLNKSFKGLNEVYVKRNGIINIIIGIIAFIISIMVYIKPQWNNILLIAYLINILILTFVQRMLTKKYK